MKHTEFLGHHSSKSKHLEGFQKGDVLDEDRYPDLIRSIYLELISDSDQAIQNNDVEAMNEYFYENGYGFTFVSDEPIKASPYQYSEYKYGDYLYEVYGTGKEIITDDPNEIGAEIIISKSPLYFKRVDSRVDESSMRIFINEDKFNAALYAKNASDQIYSFLKPQIKDGSFAKKRNFKLYWDGKMPDFNNGDNEAATLSIKVKTQENYFKGGFFEKTPDFYLNFKDALKPFGRFIVTRADDDTKFYQIFLRTDGYVAKYLSKEINKNELFKKMLSRKDTLVHELAHLYDYIVNEEGRKKNKHNSAASYFFSRSEDYAFKAQAFNYIIEEKIEYYLSNIIKDKKRSPEVIEDTSIKEFLIFYSLDKKYLYQDFQDYFKDIMRSYGLKNDAEFEQKMEKDFDKFYSKFLPIIIKNLKGIKDSSINDKNQLMLPRIKKK